MSYYADDKIAPEVTLTLKIDREDINLVFPNIEKQVEEHIKDTASKVAIREFNLAFDTKMREHLKEKTKELVRPIVEELLLHDFKEELEKYCMALAIDVIKRRMKIIVDNLTTTMDS